MDIIYQPWPWYVAGPLIALVMFLLVYSGKTFGVSSNFRTMCAIGGAGKVNDFFKFDWKASMWNLVFLGGTVIGGFIAANYLTPDSSVAINPKTVQVLSEIGIENAGQQYLPPEIFSPESAFTLKGFLILVLGGFLVGFGTRYAGGCTSGHAITGMSNLQIPSLIAVIGFFIGGLTMTYLILPLLIQ
ncbi:MAG: YeeE/YedE family protein [Chitinophagales bacterium]|nr:YeeE/YedE family protein [Chitinophagales bacterium]